MPRLILASASARRKELLEQVGLNPHCQAVDIDETPRPGELPEVLVKRLASAKATAIEPASCIVLAADTVIDLDGRILGKPADRDDALSMLMRLADREHTVISGVCVIGGHCRTPQLVSVSTQVRFGPVEKQQAIDYWNSGEPVDKAGSYGIQGLGAQFVAHLSGSYSNVVGLPLYETLELLSRAGLSCGGTNRYRGP